MMGGFDDADAGILDQVRRGDILPGFSVIAGDMNESIVRSGPEGIDVMPGGRQREHRRIDLGAIHVPGDHAAADAEGSRIRVSEVRAYLIPTLSFVGGHPHVLGASVEPLVVQWRKDDREGPLPSFGENFCLFARKETGIDLDVTDLSRATVEPGQQCALAAGIEDIGVIGILCNIAAFASAYRIGITEARLDGVVTGDHMVPVLAGHGNGRIVLLGAGHMIREIAGGNDVV